MSAVSSGLYSLGGAGFKLVIGIVGMAFFARVIAVEHHGIYEFIMAINLISLPLLDFGLLPAYLKIDKIDDEVNSVFFTLNVLIGIILTVFLVVAAPIIAHYQQLPEMTYYIMAYAFIVFVISLGSQPSSQLIKQKRFRDLAIIDIVSSTAALICGVVFALWDWAVWALLLRFIIDVFTKTCMQFYQVKPHYYMVKLATLKKYSKSVIFGAEISINRIISGLTNATDRFLIKSFYGQGSTAAAQFTVLGQFGKAASLTAKADIIRNGLTTPALSYLTALGTEHSRKYYFPLTQIFFFITALPILYFFVYGDFYVVLLMGPNWVEAGEYARFLGFYGAGLVLRGLVNIFHINEYLSKRLYQLNLLFFFSLYGILCSLYFLYGIEAIIFVRVLSFFTFAFWLIALMYSLFKFTNQRKATVRSSVNIMAVVSSFLAIGFILRNALDLASRLNMEEFSVVITLFESMIVGLVALGFSILLFWFIDSKGFMEQIELVRSRIRKI